MTRDQTAARNTITIEKFAKRVAIVVCKFVDVSYHSCLRNVLGD